MSSVLDRCAEIEAGKKEGSKMTAEKTVRKRGNRTGKTFALTGGSEQWRDVADQIQRLGFIERNNRRYSIVALVALKIAVLNYNARSRVSYSYTRRKRKENNEIL